jgi:hypothetical protein
VWCVAVLGGVKVWSGVSVTGAFLHLFKMVSEIVQSLRV